MKKMLTSITLVMLITQQVFAATNPLLDPTKKSSTIVDIGYNHEKIPVATTIPKTLIDIPALSREIDKNILMKDRIVDTKDCLTDDNGFETCPTNTETCQGNLVYNEGTATPHSGHTEVSAINRGFNISDATTACNDHFLSAMFVHVPSQNLIQVLYLNASPSLALGAGCSSKYTTAKFPNVNIPAGGPITISINSSGAGCSDNSVSKTLTGMPVAARELTGAELFSMAQSNGIVKNSGTKMSNVDLTYYDYNVAYCNAGGAQYPTVTIQSSTIVYECPNSNYTLVNTDRCKIDYTYYTYTCPSTAGENNANITWADVNAGGSWYGPVNAGGDCGAVGVADGGICGGATAATPPSTNCFRTSYSCPSDPTKDCAKISNNGAVGTNIFSGYQYAAGDATQHTKTLNKDFTCPNGGTYDSTKKACFIGKEFVCVNSGYTYDRFIGQCVADAVCNDNWNPATNKCESIPTIDCPTGFTYNTITMNCDKKQDCAVGTLNTTTNLCESTPNCGTDPSWRYDSATMLCYKDLDTANKLYQEIKPSLQRTVSNTVNSTAYAFTSTDLGSATFGGWIGNYKVNVGVLNYKFYTPVAGTYKFTYEVDDAGDVIIDGITIINASGWSSVFTATMYLNVGEHTIQLTGHDIYGGPRGQALVIQDSANNIIWNTRTGQPNVLITTTNIVNYCDPAPEYQLVNNSLCYFDYNSYSICPTGYTFNTTYDICYKSTGQEILETRMYQKQPSCQGGGVFNNSNRMCELNPTCFNGTINNTNHTCNTNETNICNAPTIAVNGLDFVGGIWTPRISGYDTLCANSNLCPNGGTQTTINDIAMCVSPKTVACPEGYIPNPQGSGECLSSPVCPEGYIPDGANCKLTYNWSTYTCPTGWQGPVEPGADCNGSCNEDGCWCNMPNSPANNCKTLLNVSTSGTYTTMEKRDMEKHIIRGTSFSPEDLGEFRDMSCGSDCAYYINKITGNGNNICFEKKNGEKKCLPVDNCYFTGEITPNSDTPNDFIKTLSLIDPHTLRSNYEIEMGDLGLPATCRIGTYNPVTKKCDGVMPLTSWTIEGNPSSGAWSLRTMEGEQEFYQELNLLNTMYMYPDKLNNSYTISGQIKPRTQHQNSIGLVFGWESDSSMYLIDWGSQSYWCNYYSNCGLNLNGMSYGALNLIKVNSSNEAYGTYMRQNSDLLANNMSPNWNAGNWYNISATINGGNVKVFIDGTMYLDYTLPNGAVFPEGRVGFFNLSTPDVSYRRFRVSNMEPECAAGTFFDTRDSHCHAYSCAPGYTLDYNTNTCAQSITSTCRMNGHVGWTGRQGGISSLGAGGMKTTVALLQATGNASYNSNNNWQGFNIANMAVKLSDGFWYVVDQVKDPAGNVLPRGTIPSSVKLIDKSFYQIMDTNPNTLTCKFNGVQVNGYCGNSIKMILPETKMTVLAFSDIESIIGLDSVTADNTFNLNVAIGSNSFAYSGVKRIPEKNLEGLLNLVLEPEYDTYLSNKLDFWDSFVDKDIGFLEFIREVKSEDRADNFVPENVIPYDMLAEGFTVNEYVPDISGVLYVKPTKTDSVACNAFANKLGGSIVSISSFPVDLQPFAYTRGIGEVGACAIKTNNIPASFDFVNFAIRKNFYTGGFEYKCSPYTCSNHECATATCVTETIGGTNMQNGVVTSSQTVTYQGTILPDSLKPTDPTICTNQVCDAKLNYVRQCGREVGCEQRANVTFDSVNNKCLESYCDNGGVLNTSTNTCQSFKCPYGTIENAAGACVRP